jgi:hypothetical protein
MTTSWSRQEEDTLRYLDGRLEYAVRVRGTATPTFLWGSAGITGDITFAAPLILHIGNDRYGQQITLGTQAAGGAQTAKGTLQPGEVVSLPVQDITGVYATCAAESIVRCVISKGGSS